MIVENVTKIDKADFIFPKLITIKYAANIYEQIVLKMNYFEFKINNMGCGSIKHQTIKVSFSIVV